MSTKGDIYGEIFMISLNIKQITEKPQIIAMKNEI